MLHNIPAERESHLLCDRSLKSCTIKQTRKCKTEQ